jgi:hypothetical protein
MKAIVHHEFVLPNTTVSSDFYCYILASFREDATEKTGTLVQPQMAPSSQ